MPGRKELASRPQGANKSSLMAACRHAEICSFARSGLQAGSSALFYRRFGKSLSLQRHARVPDWARPARDRAAVQNWASPARDRAAVPDLASPARRDRAAPCRGGRAVPCRAAPRSAAPLPGCLPAYVSRPAVLTIWPGAAARARQR